MQVEPGLEQEEFAHIATSDGDYEEETINEVAAFKRDIASSGPFREHKAALEDMLAKYIIMRTAGKFAIILKRIQLESFSELLHFDFEFNSKFADRQFELFQEMSAWTVQKQAKANTDFKEAKAKAVMLNVVQVVRGAWGTCGKLNDTEIRNELNTGGGDFKTRLIELIKGDWSTVIKRGVQERIKDGAHDFRDPMGTLEIMIDPCVVSTGRIESISTLQKMLDFPTGFNMRDQDREGFKTFDGGQLMTGRNGKLSYIPITDPIFHSLYDMPSVSRDVIRIMKSLANKLRDATRGDEREMIERDVDRIIDRMGNKLLVHMPRIDRFLTTGGRPNLCVASNGRVYRKDELDKIKANYWRDDWIWGTKGKPVRLTQVEIMLKPTSIFEEYCECIGVLVGVIHKLDFVAEEFEDLIVRKL